MIAMINAMKDGTKKMKKNKYDEIMSCCTHYETTDYCKGYIMNKHIKIVQCQNCGEVHLVANWFWSFLFTHFLRFFWDGGVYIEIPAKEDNNEE